MSARFGTTQLRPVDQAATLAFARIGRALERIDRATDAIDEAPDFNWGHEGTLSHAAARLEEIAAFLEGTTP